MSLFNYNTSNPAFKMAIWRNKDLHSKKMSMNGILIKTCFCLILLTISTWYIWSLVHKGINVKWHTSLGLLAAIILSILTSYKKKWAKYTAPLYAIAKGFFLGGFSAYTELHFKDIPMKAVGITIISFFVILLLYKLKVIKVNKKIRSIVISVATTIMFVYLISWFLSFFGISIKFIYGPSWFAICFNLFAAAIAALSLLLDFNYIEYKINRAPKYMEWVATWGLLVTLFWLYIEILRLIKKFTIRL